MLAALKAAGLEVNAIDLLDDPYGVFFKAKRLSKMSCFESIIIAIESQLHYGDMPGS